VTVKRIHYYHADGSSVGGFITLPSPKIIPTQAAVSLPAAGGSTSSAGGVLEFDGIVSCSRTETHSSGSENIDGGWSTLISSTVENVNIRNAVTADLLVAQVSIDHPADGYVPTVTFVGSQFVNLRIGGVLVEPVINTGLLTPDPGHLETPWLKKDGFLTTIRKQAAGRKSHGKPNWVADVFPVADPTKKIDDKGYVLCSLVDNIPGEFPGEAHGHVVRVPDVGKFYFGEVLVDHGAFRLTMIRAELGSPVTGTMTMASGNNNGHTDP
jgi:hypothetical protein